MCLFALLHDVDVLFTISMLEIVFSYNLIPRRPCFYFVCVHNNRQKWKSSLLCFCKHKWEVKQGRPGSEANSTTCVHILSVFLSCLFC